MTVVSGGTHTAGSYLFRSAPGTDVIGCAQSGATVSLFCSSHVGSMLDPFEDLFDLFPLLLAWIEFFHNVSPFFLTAMSGFPKVYQHREGGTHG